MLELKYTLFDGENIWNGATITIDELGTIKEGKKAVLLLIEGRPDKMITDTTKIKQIWVDGKPIL